MPIYEYQCNECDEITEEFDKITSTIKIIKCPLCGCDAKKIVSTTQAYQPYTGARRQEETIERSTAVTSSYYLWSPPGGLVQKLYGFFLSLN